MVFNVLCENSVGSGKSPWGHFPIGIFPVVEWLGENQAFHNYQVLIFKYLENIIDPFYLNGNVLNVKKLSPMCLLCQVGWSKITLCLIFFYHYTWRTLFFVRTDEKSAFAYLSTEPGLYAAADITIVYFRNCSFLCA